MTDRYTGILWLCPDVSENLQVYWPASFTATCWITRENSWVKFSPDPLCPPVTPRLTSTAAWARGSALNNQRLSPGWRWSRRSQGRVTSSPTLTTRCRCFPWTPVEETRIFRWFRRQTRTGYWPVEPSVVPAECVLTCELQQKEKPIQRHLHRLDSSSSMTVRASTSSSAFLFVVTGLKAIFSELRTDAHTLKAYIYFCFSIKFCSPSFVFFVFFSNCDND